MIHDDHGGNEGGGPAVDFPRAPEMTPHTPDSLLALARNFMESRVLLTGAELDLFTLLAPEPLGLDEIASKTGADPRALEMLLDALAAQGLLVKEGGRWRTEPSVAPFLVEGAEGSVLPMVLHAANLWNRWSELTRKVAPEACRRGRPGVPRGVHRRDARRRRAAGRPDRGRRRGGRGAPASRRGRRLGDVHARIPPRESRDDGHAVRPAARRGDGAKSASARPGSCLA